ncbi:DUF3891 family protein [Alkalicoccus daliensis]|uniref:DUF3891 family protein n=1 Tax=Alkalicoccus daliensis TaxID=745820 RepID=A0A1G9ZY57_9BACI|nr:DUF3891 family protein [Alkalicoccus daliensis]SDN26004.1 Protein of unknown function [Alkalicoccus daliensis]
MIIQEKEHSYIMISQHDHAAISGSIARNYAVDYFPFSDFQQEFIQAVLQHDQAWVEIDKVPVWNDVKGRPYSFIDFPVPMKLVHYKAGIDSHEPENPYGALLQSKHYASLVGESEEEAVFWEREKDRQQKIIQLLGLTKDHEELIEEHFKALQFCDSVSLYTCMQPPGTENKYKNAEHGFQHGKQFKFSNGEDVIGDWKNNMQIQLSPHPFKEDFDVTLLYKEVQKDDISIKGIAKAYHGAPLCEHKFTFVS